MNILLKVTELYNLYCVCFCGSNYYKVVVFFPSLLIFVIILFWVRHKRG